jgi:hypothetical protein
LAFLLALNGCNKDPKPLSKPESARSSSAGIAITQANTYSAIASSTKQKKLAPIDLAQKQYLKAYDNYVRLLRESGPQTMETLQALADYQKKYRIYQMLLNAE